MASPHFLDIKERYKTMSEIIDLKTEVPDVALNDSLIRIAKINNTIA
jgi:hypothetical protein